MGYSTCMKRTTPLCAALIMNASGMIEGAGTPSLPHAPSDKPLRERKPRCPGLMTQEEADYLYHRVQFDRCMVCGGPETYLRSDGHPYVLSLDHWHACCPGAGSKCGRCVRFYLCRACNMSLGPVERQFAQPTEAQALYLRMCYMMREGIIPHPLELYRTREAGGYTPWVGPL